MASQAWDVASKAATVAQLGGLDVFSLYRSVKQMVDSAATLPSEVQELSAVLLTGRIVQSRLAISDDPAVLILLPKLDKELKTAASIIPHALKEPTLRADPIRKEVVTTNDKIKSLLETLNAAANSRHITMQAVVNEKMLELHAAVMDLLRAGEIKPHTAAESLSKKLRELAHRDMDRQCVVQNVESAPHGSAKWSPARTSAPADAGPAEHRGFLVGDYELQNNVKIRVTLKSHQTLYFHIVTAPSEGQPPELIYPMSANSNNELSASSQRKFPVLGETGFRKVWMITKEKTVPRRQTQKLSVYFVFTTEKRRGTGDASLTIADVENILSSGEVIVEALDLLVK